MKVILKYMFGKILIVLLMLTSLIPSMSLGGDNLRYIPAFSILFMLAAYALFCLKDRANRERMRAYCKGNKGILITVILYIITIWISSYKTGIKESIAMITGISAVLFIMHFIFPVLIKTREDIFFIARVLFIIGLLNAVFAAGLFIEHEIFDINYGIFKLTYSDHKYNMLPGLKEAIIMGFFSNPNSLGVLMAATLPTGLLLATEARQRSLRLIVLSYLLLSVFVLIVSFSRASLVAAMFTLGLFIVLRKKAVYNLARIFMGAVVILLTVLILSGSNFELFLTFGRSFTDRTDLWSRAIELLHENMLHGIGPANITKLLPRSTHNTYMEISLGFGVIALLLYSAWLIALLQRIKWRKDSNLSIYALLTFSSFMILQIFETLQFGGMSIANFYFLTALLSYLSVVPSDLTAKYDEMRTFNGSPS